MDAQGEVVPPPARAKAPAGTTERPARASKTTVAESLAAGQKEISVAEFFERNRQILGFDSPTKALVTAVKEAVDNALDACEEAGTLPDIDVRIEKTDHADELTVVVEDNGPGIVKAQMPNIFGRLLYGSRFHAIRQSRGQQGIGISAVVLYGQLTTGRHAVVASKIGVGHPAVRLELGLDTKTNRPEVFSTTMEEGWHRESGTRVAVTIKAKFQGGRQSVFEFLRGTSIVNPHARLSFTDPNGVRTVFERVSDEVPPRTVEIKPHPYGTELGTILKMAKDAKERKLSTFLTDQFSSVGNDTAKRILDAAGLDNIDPKDLSREEARALYEAFPKVKIMAPPTDCLSPIGEQLVRRGLKKETEDVSPEYITTVTRPPSVWGGHPFQVEVGIVYGGTLGAEEQVRIMRFANRVPLLYQGGGCVSTTAVQDVDWRRYGLEQRGGQGMPTGPAIIAVHVCSTKVPFTSEAKEAIAPLDEIQKEVKLALQEAARGLGRHLAKKAKRAKVSEKFKLVSQILPRINTKAASVLGKPEVDLAPIVCKIMDVVWIEDPVVEYQKLEGQTITVAAPKGRGGQTPGSLAAPDDTAAAPKPKPAAVAGAPKEPAKEAKAAKGKEEAKGKDAKGNQKKAETTLDAFSAADAAMAEAGIVPPAAAEAEAPKPRQAYLAKCSLTMTNYMMGSKKFRFYVVVPETAVVAEADPKPKHVKDRYIEWEIQPLKPTEKLTLKFDVAGVGKGDLDDPETFVAGINEVHVVGADPWHGGEE